MYYVLFYSTIIHIKHKVVCLFLESNTYCPWKASHQVQTSFSWSVHCSLVIVYPHSYSKQVTTTSVALTTMMKITAQTTTTQWRSSCTQTAMYISVAMVMVMVMMTTIIMVMISTTITVVTPGTAMATAMTTQWWKCWQQHQEQQFWQMCRCHQQHLHNMAVWVHNNQWTVYRIR